MKIAVLHPENQFCSWSMGAGLVSTLRRMGHDSTDIVMPTSRQADERVIAHIKKEKPKIEELAQQDLIIVSGPEHIVPWIDAIYGREAWAAMQVPKAAWLHESCKREDYQIDIDTIQWVGDQFFFAGEQDADYHDQEAFLPGRSHWLPLGVDTVIFRPHPPIRHIEFDLAFIGLLYPKRQLYMQALGRHNHPVIRLGQVNIGDIRGFDAEGTALRLADNYRSIRVFLNLPSLSNMLVSKVYEVMACGTFLLTPELPEGGKKNMVPFETGKHLVYYKPSNIPFVAQLLRDWPSKEKDEERNEIAAAGCQEVREKHSLTVRLEQMLTTMKVEVAQ